MKKVFFIVICAVCAMMVNARTIYLNTGGSGLWNQADAVFFAHTWSGSASADILMTEASLNVFKADVDNSHTGIIFLRMPAGSTSVIWDGNGKYWNKTGDLTITSANDLYTITGWGENDGYWSKTDTSSGEEEEETPVVWFLKGEFNDWSEGNPFVEKDGGDAGVLYTTLEALPAGQTYEFKLNSGDSWLGNNGTMTAENHTGWVFTATEGNAKLVTDAAGDYEFALETATMKVSVAYPAASGEGGGEGGGEDPLPSTDWLLKGDFNNWEGAKLEAKEGGAANTLYATVTLPAGKELGFKISQGDDWYGNGGTMTQAVHSDWVFSVAENSNCNLATTIAGNYEFAFNTAAKTVSVNYPSNPKQATLYETAVRDNNPDVMLQAFYWAHEGNTATPYKEFGSVDWADLNNESGDLAKYFDLVWLAPSQETADFTGYLPMNYGNQGIAEDFSGHHGHSPWGSANDLRNLINNLHKGGAKVVADIVLNHTSAGHVDEYEGDDKNWCDWTLNDFGRYGQYQIDWTWLTAEEEMFADDYMEGRIDRSKTGDCGNHDPATLTPDDKVVSYKGGTFNWDYQEYNSKYSRDLAHGKKEVREMSRAYLTWMRDSIGYDGFRFDFMKGIHGSHLFDYLRATAPYFCVAEVFDGDIDKQGGFLYDANYSTYVFDFPGKFSVYNAAIREYQLQNLKNFSSKDYKPLIFTDKKKYAVTFIDNHDSFHEGSNLYGTENMMDDRQARMALAYLLSMPGVPCIVYPYWNNHKEECMAFIKARKAAGVHSESEVVGEWAGSGSDGDNYYTAIIKGTKGYVFLKLGYDCVPNDAPMEASPDGKAWKCAWANREHAGVWYTGDWEPTTPTELENTESAVKATKFMENGVLYIQRGNEVYNIQGVRVR